jgi:L-lactate dehydrogenase complex protein LldG
MNREAFLARVRSAAQAGQRYRVAVEPVPSGAGYVGAAGDLCEALAREIALVGGDPLLVPDWPAAREAVAHLLRQYRPATALCWEHAALEQLDLPVVLQQQGITGWRYADLKGLSPESLRASLLSADVGISSADFAIAETGTLVVRARPGQERLVSLLPPVHLAVIARDQILPDLFDLFARLAEQGLDQLPSNLALITGPSKTGDIELELTTGVHGPGKWHVVIVREPLGTNGTPPGPE